MAYMHTCTTGVGKFYQTIKLGLFAIVFGFEDFTFFPFCLPFWFNSLVIIFHLCDSSTKFVGNIYYAVASCIKSIEI